MAEAKNIIKNGQLDSYFIDLINKLEKEMDEEVKSQIISVVS